MELIELKEAAELLGVTPQVLAEMRSRNEISAYRDGTTWKFRKDEIDRFLAAAEKASGSGSSIQLDEDLLATGSGSGLDADLDEFIELGAAGAGTSASPSDVLEGKGPGDPTASSTVIGKSKSLDAEDESAAAAAESAADEFQLDFEDLDPSPGSSSIRLGGPAQSGQGSEIAFDSGGSELRLDLSDEGELAAGQTGSGLSFGGESSVLADSPKRPGPPRADETGAISAEAAGDDDLILGSDIRLDLEDDDADLGKGKKAPAPKSSELSDLLLAPTDTDLKLGDKINLDAGSSAVSLDAGESGINLVSPSDSGISLEQTPPEIAIGGDSLELGEADIDFGLDDDLGGLDESTAIKGDEDFLLTPLEGDAFEESDSGSQVIALDSEEFSDTGSTVLGGDRAAGPGPDFAESPDEGAGAAVLAGMPAVSMIPEATYSVWNVVGLGMITLLLGLGGIMVFDVVRHIWSWDAPYSLNSTLMDAITGVFSN